MVVHTASLLSSCLFALLPMRVPLPHPAPALAVAGLDLPAAEQQLYELCQTRRPSDWTAEERLTVDRLVSELVALGRRAPSGFALRGKWRLAYVHPGLQDTLYPGAERTQLLELPWNEKYQILGVADVINVAEILGPLLEVRAAGSITEDANDGTSPRRVRTELAQGAICGSVTIGTREKANTGRLCGPLPIRGDGSFDALYVGPRIRISENVEGGGARTVHVRITSFGGYR